MSRRLLRVGGRFYRQIRDGEWVTIHRNYRKGCCDCSLVHVVNLRVGPGGKLQYQAVRDRRATRALRAAAMRKLKGK